MSARGRSYAWSILYLVGLLSVYLGERIVTPGRMRAAFTVGGVVLLVIAIAVRALRVHGAQGDRRRIELYLLGLYFVGLAGLLLYFAQSDVWARFGAKPLHDSSPRLAVVLAVLWPALVVAALIPLALVELSYGAMALAEQVEAARVRDAALSGLGLAAALVFAFAAVYVFSE
ncbi:MAG TPA: ABC transporter, partial [Myxococcaceae bacterium]|nr:ABC transporter [Myxococcaceae bacterium]